MDAAEEKIVAKLRDLRDRYEADKANLLDSHMLRHIHLSDFWRHVKRSALEVEAWPEWQQKACLSGKAFKPKKKNKRTA